MVAWHGNNLYCSALIVLQAMVTRTSARLITTNFHHAQSQCISLKQIFNKATIFHRKCDAFRAKDPPHRQQFIFEFCYLCKDYRNSHTHESKSLWNCSNKIIAPCCCSTEWSLAVPQLHPQHRWEGSVILEAGRWLGTSSHWYQEQPACKPFKQVNFISKSFRLSPRHSNVTAQFSWFYVPFNW